MSNSRIPSGQEWIKLHFNSSFNSAPAVLADGLPVSLSLNSMPLRWRGEEATFLFVEAI